MADMYFFSLLNQGPNRGQTGTTQGQNSHIIPI